MSERPINEDDARLDRVRQSVADNWASASDVYFLLPLLDTARERIAELEAKNVEDIAAGVKRLHDRVAEVFGWSELTNHQMIAHLKAERALSEEAVKYWSRHQPHDAVEAAARYRAGAPWIWADKIFGDEYARLTRVDGPPEEE